MLTGAVVECVDSVSVVETQISSVADEELKIFMDRLHHILTRTRKCLQCKERNVKYLHNVRYV